MSRTFHSRKSRKIRTYDKCGKRRAELNLCEVLCIIIDKSFNVTPEWFHSYMLGYKKLHFTFTEKQDCYIAKFYFYDDQERRNEEYKESPRSRFAACKIISTAESGKLKRKSE